MSVALADGEKLIEAYATDAGSPGLDMLPPGLWQFRFWRYVSNIGGVSRLVFRVYKRATNGDETEVFNVSSAEINDTTVTREVVEYTTTNPTTLLVTDRIVVKVFATHDTASAKTVHFVHDGSLHNSALLTPITEGSLAQPYDFGFYMNGKPSAGLVMLRVPLTRPTAYPINLSGSRGVSSVAFKNSKDFSIRKNNVEFAVMRFAANAATATFISASGATFAAGDILSVIAPSPADPDGRDIGFILTGTR